MSLNTNKLMLVVSQAPYWLYFTSNPQNDHYEIYIISLSCIWKLRIRLVYLPKVTQLVSCYMEFKCSFVWFLAIMLCYPVFLPFKIFIYIFLFFIFSFITSVQFSYSVMSDSLRPHGLQHARLPCPSTTPRACSNSCPSSQWVL